MFLGGFDFAFFSSGSNPSEGTGKKIEEEGNSGGGGDGTNNDASKELEVGNGSCGNYLEFTHPTNGAKGDSSGVSRRNDGHIYIVL